MKDPYEPGSTNTAQIVCHIANEYREVDDLVLYALSRDNRVKRGEMVTETVVQQVVDQCLRYVDGAAAESGGGSGSPALPSRPLRIRFNGGALGRFASTLERIEKSTEAIASASPEKKPLNVYILLNYSGRESLKAIPENASFVMPFDLDLIVRSAGEMRLSDFCPYESSYAELISVEELWPEVTPGIIDDVVHEYARRRRKMGGL